MGSHQKTYNFDETGFAMGLVATAQVVTRADYYGKASFVQPGNREWVTFIEMYQFYWIGTSSMHYL